MSNNAKVLFLSNISPGSGSDSGPVINESEGIDNNERVTGMSDNNYVTHKDLNHLEEKTNLKLENIKTELKGEFTNLETKMDGKFSNLDEKLEKMFLQQKIEIAKERRETNKWIIGTGIAIIAAVTAIIRLWL